MCGPAVADGVERACGIRSAELAASEFEQTVAWCARHHLLRLLRAPSLLLCRNRYSAGCYGFTHKLVFDVVSARCWV